MTTTDWIIDIVLVLIVVRQLKEGRIDVKFVAIPAVIVYYVARSYLHGIPTAGNDLVLIAAALGLGGLLGVAGGLTTRVRAENGHAYVKATATAAGIWVVSMTARLGFIIWCTHGSGAASLGRFSVDHDLTGSSVWPTALVLLALSEVVVRLGIILARGYRATAAAPAVPEELVSL